MKRGRKRPGVLLALTTLALAMLMTIVPIPAGLEDYRPPWVALTLIFWCLALPERVGVFWGFGTGLLVDILEGALLGQSAFTLAVVAYITGVLRPRILVFPLWQQLFLIWVILLLERLLALWIVGATGQPFPPLSYWLGSFSGLLIWPWLSMMLSRIGRRIRAV